MPTLHKFCQVLLHAGLLTQHVLRLGPGHTKLDVVCRFLRGRFCLVGPTREGVLFDLNVGRVSGNTRETAEACLQLQEAGRAGLSAG